MIDNNCQFCGAEYYGQGVWDCGTEFMAGKYIRSCECRKNEKHYQATKPATVEIAVCTVTAVTVKTKTTVTTTAVTKPQRWKSCCPTCGKKRRWSGGRYYCRDCDTRYCPYCHINYVAQKWNDHLQSTSHKYYTLYPRTVCDNCGCDMEQLFGKLYCKCQKQHLECPVCQKTIVATKDNVIHHFKRCHDDVDFIQIPNNTAHFRQRS